MILHGYWRSGTSYRTRIALELKGLAYDQRGVDLRRRLPDITAPVTVVYGWSADSASPRSRTDRLFRGAYARLRTPATFVPIAGAEHMVMIDQPTRFMAAVNRFLA